MTNASRDRCIDYVEFNVTNIERSKTFYANAFGWTFTDYGPNYCEFSDGRMSGGFAKGEIVSPGGPLIVLYDTDLSAAQQRVEAAGGKVVKPVFEFPGGRRFHFHDPDGYELAVWTKAE